MSRHRHQKESQRKNPTISAGVSNDMHLSLCCELLIRIDEAAVDGGEKVGQGRQHDDEEREVVEVHLANEELVLLGNRSPFFCRRGLESAYSGEKLIDPRCTPSRKGRVRDDQDTQGTDNEQGRHYSDEASAGAASNVNVGKNLQVECEKASCSLWLSRFVEELTGSESSSLYHSLPSSVP